MTADTSARRQCAWRRASDECRRAAAEWDRLSGAELAPVIEHLPPDEVIHLRHTLFRVNALTYLYSVLLGHTHNTELGVLLGVITHMVDYFYDHPLAVPSAGYIGKIDTVLLDQHAAEHDPVLAALRVLGARAWTLVPNPRPLRHYIEQMLATQRESTRQQEHTPMERAALRQLTTDKGHHSLCLYFAAVNPDFKHEEAAALRLFGNYMQLMDDIEDYYEDRREARQSPVSSLARSLLDASRLLPRALREMMLYYRGVGKNVREILLWVLFFHVVGVISFCLREVTRNFPGPARRKFTIMRERIARRAPMLFLSFNTNAR